MDNAIDQMKHDRLLRRLFFVQMSALPAHADKPTNRQNIINRLSSYTMLELAVFAADTAASLPDKWKAMSKDDNAKEAWPVRCRMCHAIIGFYGVNFGHESVCPKCVEVLEEKKLKEVFGDE